MPRWRPSARICAPPALRRGDDLATASKALKIRKDHLEALEEDRFDSLPGRTYAIGFVRSYAEYLGLDAVEAVERFKSEIAGRDECPNAPVFHEEEAERRLPHGWLIIAVVVLALVFYGAYRLAISANSLMSEPVAPVPARMASPDAQQKPAAATPPAAAPSKAPAPVANAPGTAPAATAPAAESAAPAGDQSGAAETQLPDGQVYGDRNTGARVVLRALAPTKVVVEGADGVVYINRTLKRGDSYRVPDRVGLTLSDLQCRRVADGTRRTENGRCGPSGTDRRGAVAGSAGNRRPLQWRHAVMAACRTGV